jgi:phosphatidylserine synthase
MRSICSIYLIKLELLLVSRIRIEQVNLFKLKLNLSIKLTINTILIIFFIVKKLQKYIILIHLKL